MRRARFAALLVGALVTVTTALAVPGTAFAAPSLPVDPAARGSIGLCDRGGRTVTSGSITAKPFVWRAVGSRAAQSPYDGKGTSATLYAFQPRPQVPASQWSGDTLTAASSYTNKAHPMAQATQLDFTLQDYLNEYPPMQDGLVQLRLVVGAAGVGAAPQYADAYLRVAGPTWTLVSGSSDFSCTDGKAVSSEVGADIVDKSGNAIGTAAASLGASATAAAKSSAATRSGSSASPSTGSGTRALASPAAPGSSNAPSGAGASDSSGSSGSGAMFWVIVVVVIALAGAAVWWWRRRAPSPSAD